MMPRVCIVGGGTAGLEAGREADRCGAQVTLIESSEARDPPWRSWPGLISTGKQPCGSVTALDGGFEGRVVRTEARSAGAGFVIAGDGTRMCFDSVVATTGCCFEPPSLQGRQKMGVHLLDRAGEYAELGAGAASAARVLVYGEGTRGLQVADRLGRGRKVRLVISHWARWEPSWNIRGAIFRAAEEHGVSIGYGTLTRAVGAGPLEAVVLDGKIVSCDLLAVVPRRIPRVIPMPAQTGRVGGFTVDRYLMTTAAGTFAAGGCAEFPSPHGTVSTLENDTGMSGRVAGANAAGRHLAFEGANPREFHFFGLRWTLAGTAVAPLRESPAIGVTSQTLEGSACTIAYERSTGLVAGVEAVEDADAAPADLSAVAPGLASLRTLAYGGSSDISLVSETARLGLRTWQSS